MEGIGGGRRAAARNWAPTVGCAGPARLGFRGSWSHRATGDKVLSVVRGQTDSVSWARPQQTGSCH